MALDVYQTTITAPNAVPGNPQSLVIATPFRVKGVFVEFAQETAYASYAEPAYFQYGYGFERESLPGSFYQQSFQFGTRWDGLFLRQAGWCQVGNSVLSLVSQGTSWSGTVEQNMAITAIDNVSVTLTWTYVNSVGGPYKYNVTMLGGDIRFAAGVLNTPTVTGVQAIPHGLGEPPTCAQFMIAVLNTLQNSPVTNRGSNYMRGFTDGTRQGVSVVCDPGNGLTTASPSIGVGYQRADKCVALLNTATGAFLAEAELSSVDATNINLNWTSVGSFAVPLYWLAMSQVVARVGSFSQRTSAGAQNVDTAPVAPLAGLYQSVGFPTATTPSASVRLTYGMADLNEAVFNANNQGVSSTATRRSVRVQSNGGALYSGHPTGVNSGADDAIGSIAFAASSFDITWTLADAVAREWIYLVLGEDSPAAPGTIVVTKVVPGPVDVTTFDFTAGGGLSPTTFSLQQGLSQLFTPVTAGSGYSIAETPNADYVTTIEVSNGSPVDNLLVAPGETVTVTVTNTPIVPEGEPGCPLDAPAAATVRDGCANIDL